MSKENIIQAIGVSDGVSYAKCLCIKKPAIDVHSSSNWISKNIALEKLDEAIAKTQEQLEKIKVLSKEKLGEEKSSIFDAHIQMANDPEMLNQIKEKMVGERVNLVKIIDDVFDQYYEMFTVCTSLTTAPALPAIALENYCCWNVQGLCISNNYAWFTSNNFSK